MDDVGVEQAAGMGLHPGAEVHGPDCAGGDVDLEATVAGILHGGVEDAVEVLLLDVVRISENQFADAIAGELFDQRAARPGTADDPDTQPTELVVRAGTEGLCDPATELGNGGRRGGGWPERKVIAHDVDCVKGVEASALVD